MTDFVKIAAAVIIVTLITVFFKNGKSEYALIISVSAGAIILVPAFLQLKSIFSLISDYSKITEISTETMKIFFKAVGISLICEITKDVCIDNGNRFLAECTDVCGRAAILCISLPLINSVMKIIIQYIGVK